MAKANLRWSVPIGPLRLSGPVTFGAVAVIVLCCCGGALFGSLTDDGTSPPERSTVVDSTATAAPTVRSSPSPSPTTVKPSPTPKRTTAAPKPATTKPKPPPEPKTDPRYDTCKDANAHGYGPYVEGEDPEYEWYQDRDGDGVVCEQA